MNETGPKKVYQAILAVQGELAKVGISKDKTCTQGASYKFRGIDDVYNALAPLLAENKLCILPRMLAREVVERESKAGSALFYTTVTAEFDFISSEDGSMHTVGPMYGEAMDSGDKGTNKAMSAAYKYAAFQSFCIPTEGDNDTENQTHEVKAIKQTVKKEEAKTVSVSSAILKKELLDFNFGNVPDAAEMLKRLSTFKGKDDNETFCTWERLDTISETWAKNILAAYYKENPKVEA